jgi:hypothetical protein
MAIGFERKLVFYLRLMIKMEIACSALADVIDRNWIVVTIRSDMQGPRSSNPSIFVRFEPYGHLYTTRDFQLSLMFPPNKTLKTSLV